MSVPQSLRFTYEDYVLLPEDRRHEVIDGELYLTPAPTPYHQLVKQRIERLLLEHVEGRALGQILDAPCDVVLSRFDVLVTFNGKSYDVPLLETRYRMARARPPFTRMAHLDLLHGARRLWKLRLDSCRLVDLGRWLGERYRLAPETEGEDPTPPEATEEIP